MPATTPTPNDTDESLMLRYAGGELSTFDTLYTRHEMAVWRFVFRSVRNQAVADDLMQDVWFAVARQGLASSPGRPKTEAAPPGGGAAHEVASVGAAAGYEVKAKFRTWLFTIAHNRMVDHFRTSKNHTSLDDTSEEDQALHETLAADSGFGPVRQLQSREQAAALIQAVEALPAHQREAFLLQAEAGLSVEEIAAATGVNFETAKSRLRYARSSLKQSLREFA
ncbi:MAG: sigma-70 family RNA polymerase sigma factor [Pseudomonadota bacterium]